MLCLQRKSSWEHGSWYFQFRVSSEARIPWSPAEIMRFEVTWNFFTVNFKAVWQLTVNSIETLCYPWRVQYVKLYSHNFFRCSAINFYRYYRFYYLRGSRISWSPPNVLKTALRLKDLRTASTHYHMHVSSLLCWTLTSLVDSLAKSGFPLSICISVFLHTNSFWLPERIVQ